MNRKSLRRLFLAIACIALSTPASTLAIGKGKGPVVVPVLVAPPQTYSAPAPAPVFTAPAPVTYYQPYGTGVGSAPLAVAGSRIKAVDRSDLIEELQAEAGKDRTGSKKDRRKRLTDSLRPKYAEAVGSEEENLNEAEKTDLANIVNSIVDGDGTQYGSAPASTGYSAPAPTGYYSAPAGHHGHGGHGYGYAPSMLAPAPVFAAPAPVFAAPAPAPVFAAPAPTTWFQPMIPVPVWVPAAQPKHRLFHKY